MEYKDVFLILLGLIVLTILIAIFCRFYKNKKPRKSIKYYLELFDKKDISKVESVKDFGKTTGVKRGILGEQLVEEILKKYTSKYYKSVIVPSKRKIFFSEMDFIVPTNNTIELIEVKNWYGRVSHSDKNLNKVIVDCVNQNNKVVEHERDDPHLMISYFANDFRDLLKGRYSFSISKNNINKIVVFVRDECDFSELKRYYDGKRTIFFHPTEFEQYLSNLALNLNFNEPLLSFDLPKWDYVFDERKKIWKNIILKGDIFSFKEKHIKISEVRGILFLSYKSNKCKVLFQNGLEEILHLDYETLKSEIPCTLFRKRFFFFAINKDLHEAISNYKYN